MSWLSLVWFIPGRLDRGEMWKSWLMGLRSMLSCGESMKSIRTSHLIFNFMYCQMPNKFFKKSSCFHFTYIVVSTELWKRYQQVAWQSRSQGFWSPHPFVSKWHLWQSSTALQELRCQMENKDIFKTTVPLPIIMQLSFQLLPGHSLWLDLCACLTCNLNLFTFLQSLWVSDVCNDNHFGQKRIP